jgi:hypothetical protein
VYSILVSILHRLHPHSLRSLIISNSDETSSTRDCRAQHTADPSTYHGKLASALGDTERPLLTAGESGRERRSVVQRPFATFLLTFVTFMRSDEHSILSVDITERGIVSYTCQQLAHLDPRYLSVSSISSLLVRPEIVRSKRQHIDDTRAYVYSLTDVQHPYFSEHSTYPYTSLTITTVSACQHLGSIITAHCHAAIPVPRPFPSRCKRYHSPVLGIPVNTLCKESGRCPTESIPYVPHAPKCRPELWDGAG